MLGDYRATKTSVNITGEVVIGTDTLDNWQYLQTLNIYSYIPCDHKITFLDHYPTEMQAWIHEKYVQECSLHL